MGPDDIQPLLDRLVAACLPDERLTAVLVYGSHAAGHADSLSDLDIGLVTTAAAHDDVVPTWTHSRGPWENRCFAKTSASHRTST
jgi:hypothetical protein